MHWVALALLALGVWIILYSIVGDNALPGSQLFSLVLLFIAAYICGEAVNVFNFPPLVGMLLIGAFLRNINVVNLKEPYTNISSVLRQFSLCVILIRAGLSLQSKFLKTTMYAVLVQFTVPIFVEGTIITVLICVLLDFPWLWGILLGCIVSAISPSIIIPSLGMLKEKGYGYEKGISTILVASASLNNAFTITLFGVIFDLIFNCGKHLFK